MFDDVRVVSDNELLYRLLAHYGRSGSVDREAWQDRVMDADGVRPEELVRLHGRLLAGDWIEQNTGATPVPRGAAVPHCYRVTAAGLRLLKKVEAFRASGEDDDA